SSVPGSAWDRTASEALPRVFSHGSVLLPPNAFARQSLACSSVPGRAWHGGVLVPVKLILAIIQPSKVEAVKEALNKVEVFRLTIVDVQGFGRQKGHSEVYRGHELTVNLLHKV